MCSKAERVVHESVGIEYQYWYSVLEGLIQNNLLKHVGVQERGLGSLVVVVVVR